MHASRGATTTTTLSLIIRRLRMLHLFITRICVSERWIAGKKVSERRNGISSRQRRERQQQQGQQEQQLLLASQAKTARKTE